MEADGGLVGNEAVGAGGWEGKELSLVVSSQSIWKNGQG